MHLRSAQDHGIYKSTKVAQYAQDGETYACGSGRNTFSVQSQRFIVFEYEHESCEFSIEERWDDYSHMKSRVTRKGKVWTTTYLGNSYPRSHTVKLSNKRFYFANYNSTYADLDYKTGLLIRAFETAQPEVAMSIYHQIFYQIILSPETSDFFENPKHVPGFLETWVPEFFKNRIKNILREREQQVREVLEA